MLNKTSKVNPYRKLNPTEHMEYAERASQMKRKKIITKAKAAKTPKQTKPTLIAGQA